MQMFALTEKPIEQVERFSFRTKLIRSRTAVAKIAFRDKKQSYHLQIFVFSCGGQSSLHNSIVWF